MKNYSPKDHQEARRLLSEALTAYRTLARLPEDTGRTEYLQALKHARLVTAALRFQLDRIDAPARNRLGRGVPAIITPTPVEERGACG